MTTFERGELSRTLLVQYVLIDANIFYNILIGRTTLNALGAIMLTPHLTMKFPNQSGNIVTIKVNQVEAHNCSTKSLLVKPYTLASMKHVDAGVLIMWKALHRARPILTQGEMRKTRGQHQPRSCVVSSKEPHQMHQDRGKTWWAPSETDWGLADMPDIDPNFICHKLSIFPKPNPWHSGDGSLTRTADKL